MSSSAVDMYLRRFSRAGGKLASIFSAVISSSKRKYCTEKPCSTARMPGPRKDASCRRPTNQRHTAECPAFEIRITYPFHPRSGEMVAVVGSKRHAGVDHLVIRQSDRTLALLPVWMTEPAAASHQLVSSPRLVVERLADVRALIDALLASSRRESSRREGAGDEARTTQPKGSVRREGRGATPAARPPGQAEPAASGSPDGGGRHRPPRRSA